MCRVVRDGIVVVHGREHVGGGVKVRGPRFVVGFGRVNILGRFVVNRLVVNNVRQIKNMFLVIHNHTMGYVCGEGRDGGETEGMVEVEAEGRDDKDAPDR